MFVKATRPNCSFKLCFILIFSPIFIWILYINSNYMHCKKDAQNAESLTLSVLQNLISKVDELNNKEKFDVQPFLEKIHEEGKKWGNEPLRDDQIRDLSESDKNKTHLVIDTTAKVTSPDKLKYILYWNEAYGTTEYGFCCGQEPFIKAKCPRSDCFATNNRSYLPHNKFDAILFHQRSLDSNDLPSNRTKDQRYIMWMMESAAYPFGFDSTSWNGFFNWTMTYRTDSDFPFYYGHMIKTKEYPKNDAELQFLIETFGKENSVSVVGSKNKSVAWFVSNCQSQSKREDYVNELKKYIQVDIYGQCGSLSCPRSNESACWDIVDKDYYFYLSFENSMCIDYVTEKFFNAMERKVIPIVLGGTDYHTSAGAPPHSHINAQRDYKKPSDLAWYLQSLIDDPEKYAEYFWWKDYFKVDTTEAFRAEQGFCDACRQLHEKPETKIYSDLEEWWVHKAKCKKVRIQ